MKELETIIQIGYEKNQLKTVTNLDYLKDAGQIEDIMAELETVRCELEDMYNMYVRTRK